MFNWGDIMNRELSLDEKIGQRFIVGVNSQQVDMVIKLIKEGYVGGVILYKKNYGTYQEMIDVINRFKEANKGNKVPLFISIDQEGGVVNRLPKDIHRLEEVYLFSKDNKDKIDEYASVISDILKDTGINMNLAPVLDIYNNSKSQALESRCFYGNMDQVFELGRKYVLNFKEHKVIPVIKHYPGHGATRLDTHFFVPYVWNYKEMLNRHMVPFERMIEDGIDAIMVGHMKVRKLCGILPASLNRNFIMNYLRNKYDGLIISDECNMLKRHFVYRFMYEKRITTSGCDMVLLKLKSINEFYRMRDKYMQVIQNNKEIRDELEVMVKRILRVKKEYNVTDELVNKGTDVAKINKRIDALNNMIGDRNGK